MSVTPQALDKPTERRDNWWLEPLLYLVGLGGFGVYATWAALQGDHYLYTAGGADYLSPFYSPPLKDWFPDIFGAFPWSGAFLILWAPAGFRTTCYYYRKAYYRAFFTSPVACAVDKKDLSPLALLLGKGKQYVGETAIPLIMQNIHRYFFYVAAIFMVMLAIDAYKAYWFNGQFGIGGGSLVLTLNVILLGLYTFSCHSWRHILGGSLDKFSCTALTQMRYKAWGRQSLLNEHHMEFAWLSLVWVGFSDLYVRMLSMGVWQDVRFF